MQGLWGGVEGDEELGIRNEELGMRNEELGIRNEELERGKDIF